MQVRIDGDRYEIDVIERDETGAVVIRNDGVSYLTLSGPTDHEPAQGMMRNASRNSGADLGILD